jgi:hypothetical protein
MPSGSVPSRMVAGTPGSAATSRPSIAARPGWPGRAARPARPGTGRRPCCAGWPRRWPGRRGFRRSRRPCAAPGRR